MNTIFFFRANNIQHYGEKQLVAPDGTFLYYENDGRGGWDVRKNPTVGELNVGKKGEVIHNAYSTVELSAYLNANEIKPEVAQ